MGNDTLERQCVCLRCWTVLLRREFAGGVVDHTEPTERQRAELTAEYGRRWAGRQNWGTRPGGLHRCPRSPLLARILAALAGVDR